MKKLFLLPIILLASVLTVSFVSACSYGDLTDCPKDKTVVEGRIYLLENNQSVGSADVLVQCYHNGTINEREFTSINSGFLKGIYFVVFPKTECAAGDEVVVSAEKDSLSGEEDGVVKHFVHTPCSDIDISLVNVPLVPEFTLIAGLTTIIGAVAVFFIIRRK